MTEKFKEAIDRADKFGVLLADFLKAFDCINHLLFIAKIDSYRVMARIQCQNPLDKINF